MTNDRLKFCFLNVRHFLGRLTDASAFNGVTGKFLQYAAE